MQAERAVNRITSEPATAKPGTLMNIHVSKLNENMVLVPGSLALVFEIDLTGGHANNYLVQNVTRALVSRMDVKFGEPPSKKWKATTSTRPFPFKRKARRCVSRKDTE